MEHGNLNNLKTLIHASKFFYNTEFNDANWNDIQVPGHIQLQGFDNPHYTDVTYPWDGHDVVKPGQIDMDKNKVYQYRKTFDLPQDFINHKLILSFEGVESNVLRLAKRNLFRLQRRFLYASRFDITKYVQEKDNTLCVRIFQKCTGTWLEDQDMWRFSGIFRECHESINNQTSIFKIYILIQILI